MQDDVSSRELVELLARDPRPLLLDVRTPEEWEICRLEGARLIPLASLPERLQELPHDAEIVVYCHTGRRSAIARSFLRRAGFGRVGHLAGGIEAWASEIDPTMPRY